MRTTSLVEVVWQPRWRFPPPGCDRFRLAESVRRGRSPEQFQGTFVHERNGSPPMRIWHRVESYGAVRERLLQPRDGAPEVVRVDGHPVHQRRPCRPTADAQLWPVRVRSLPAGFLVRPAPGRRPVSPPPGSGPCGDSARPAIATASSAPDRDTGLPLKSLLLNEKGQLLERFQFTQLNTGAAPAEDQLQAGAELPGHRLRPRPMAEDRGLALGMAAARFHPDPQFMRRSPVTPDPVACLTYGDGLARFSVFIEAAARCHGWRRAQPARPDRGGFQAPADR